MRVIIIIALLLQVSFASGQADNKQVITLEGAIKMAFRNNPGASSNSDRKKLSRDIKSTWNLWLFKIHKWQTLQDYQYLLGDLDRIAPLRYLAGDIDLAEKSTFLTLLAEIKTASTLVANEIDITGNLLKQLIFVNEDIVPADTALSIYEIDKGAGDEIYLSNQSDSGVQGDTLLIRYQTFITAKSIENKQLELDGYFIKLRFYNSYGLAHAGIILQTSLAKFNAEEIDYTEFSESIAEAFKIRLEYLETLNNYNQSAINLEYYAY